MLIRLALAAILVGAPLAARAETPAEGAAEVIEATGCVSKGVEGGCMVLTDEHGKHYSFTSAAAAAGQCARVTGTKTIGFCMQGTQLAVKTLEPVEPNCCKEK